MSIKYEEEEEEEEFQEPKLLIYRKKSILLSISLTHIQFTAMKDLADQDWDDSGTALEPSLLVVKSAEFDNNSLRLYTRSGKSGKPCKKCKGTGKVMD